MDFDDDLGFPPPVPAAVAPQGAPPGPAGPMDLPPPGALPPPRQIALGRPRAPHLSRAKAGLGVVVAAAACGVGGVLAGPLGALAGLTGVGALRNLYRAQGLGSSDPAEKNDAARSLALGVVGLGILGFLGYKLYQSKDDK